MSVGELVVAALVLWGILEVRRSRRVLGDNLNRLADALNALVVRIDDAP